MLDSSASSIARRSMPDAETGRWREPPLERLDVVLVDGHRLVFARGGQSGLLFEARALLDGIDELTKPIRQLPAHGVGLEALGHLGIATMAPRQWRDLHGMLGDERRVPQRRLGEILEQFGEATPGPPRRVHGDPVLAQSIPRAPRAACAPRRLCRVPRSPVRPWCDAPTGREGDRATLVFEVGSAENVDARSPR